jgi:membrane fusion protein, copper/silver efflux system
MKSSLTGYFICSKAHAVGEGGRPGFFSRIRMTCDRLRRAQGARRKGRRNTLFIPHEYFALYPAPRIQRHPECSEGSQRLSRLQLYHVRLFVVTIFCAVFLIAIPNAFSQGHDMGSMSMPEDKAKAAKPQTVQSKSQKEEAVQEVPKVEITPEQQKLIGVKVVKVFLNPMTKVIRTVGRIETNERNIATVNAKIEGWIEKLYVDYTGSNVKKGQPLAEIYSPDLLTTQMEFINTLQWTTGQGRDGQALGAGSEAHDSTGSSSDSISNLQGMLQKDAADTRDAARQRLLLWDMSEAQINQVEKTGKPIRTITIYSPISGSITQKMAILGMKVMSGEKLFDIVDLSNLWVIADIYEYELPFVKVGQEAKLNLAYMPDRELSAKVDFIYPIVAEDTRTVKIRFSVPNPGEQLKPQMYTNVEITVKLGNRLSIPESAIIDTGTEQVVYVDLGDGNFEPREVKLGLRTGGYAEVLQGLKEGEGVSSSANFLIDSEAQLRGVKPLSGK